MKTVLHLSSRKGDSGIHIARCYTRNVKRTTIWVSDEDREAIRTIKVRYGVSTDSDAVRLALRVLSRAQDIGLAPLPKRLGGGKEETRE
jgi:Arc/MetJ family transcription regulator